jgi:hypothetical protein
MARRQGDPASLAPTALIASAARLDLTKRPKNAIQQEWQKEAWDFYDSVGEVRYAAQWMGNSLSRATIYAADIDANGKPSGTPTSDPIASSVAYDLLGGPTNMSQILQQVGIHLMVAGDVYIVGETPVDEGGNPLPDDDWYVASTDELSYRAGKWHIDRGNGSRPLVTDKTVIIRVWLSHPRKKWQADSPLRAVLPVLRELASLVRVSGQQMDSRLAGAGLLILPTGVVFPPPSAEAIAANPDADPLMLSLAENILVPLEDPDDSSRLVPMALRVPPEAVDKVRHLTFASAIYAENADMREACIRRLALGLDMPPEQLLGKGNINHWGAWQIAEEGVKLHVSPRLVTIVNALHEGYYAPALRKLGIDPSRFTLWFDVTNLISRPNRGSDAQSLWDRDALSDAALRRENNFDESDAPTREEIVARTLIKVVKAQPALLETLFPELDVDWDAVRGTVGTEPAQPQDTPTGTELPGLPGAAMTPRQEAVLVAANEIREIAPQLASREIVCAHLLTQRALDIAGKRMMTRGMKAELKDIDPRRRHEHVEIRVDQLPYLLQNAFDWVEELALMVRLDPVRLRRELVEYVGSLIIHGQPHDVSYLTAVVKRAKQAVVA